MPSFRSSTLVKMNTVSPSAKEIFSSRRKMISPYCSHSSCDWSVVKPSSARRRISRCTGSLPTGDSSGFSALSCILVDEANQIGEFKRFAQEVVRAALPRLLGDVAVAGEDDVGDGLGLRGAFECVAQILTAHPFDGQVGEDHRRAHLLGPLERGLPV